ncbi:peptidase M50 [Clostridium baratii]|uniref:site-2 protease family protein n=1 Tax=Clostridium baratii TaxID=1561 RepID=UPI0009A3A210|nr:site-2 protease family protein [Clostridium baratii]OPF52760.1 peptidase M50 [Clostridium baratii]OPF56209.1 peptidase M50 [Clostridium baratii]OPF58196.1 peptidase M50 [Clostridium baratii]OPF59409.1 peptidase M50 [Clostridium baratii]
MKSYKVIVIELMLLVLAISFQSEIFIGIISIILHEFTHIFFGNRFGCKLYNLKIGITGANAELSDIEELSENEKLILYLSGPLMNLFLAFILYIIFRLTNIDIFNMACGINLGLFVFNLFPAYPLDGARVLEIILSKYIIYKRSKKIVEILSFFIASILIVMFFVSILLHKVNISLILISGLIIYSTVLEMKITMYIVMGDMIRKRRRLKKYDFIENRTVSVYYKNELLNVMRLVDKSKFNVFYILDDELKVLKIISENELLEALKNYGNINLEEYINISNENNIN